MSSFHLNKSRWRTGILLIMAAVVLGILINGAEKPPVGPDRNVPGATTAAGKKSLVD